MPSANADSNEPTRVLPLWAVLREACQFPWHHRRQVVGLLLIPVSLSILLDVIGTWWINSTDTSLAGTAFALAYSQLQLLPFTFFAVSYHRVILIGEHAISRFGVPGWTMRETRFLFWIISIYLVTFLFMFLVGAALSVLTISVRGIMGEAVVEHPAYLFIIAPVVLIPWVYYIGRMSLVLPAVAIDLRPSFNSAMSLSERNEWRVALLVGGAPVAFWGLLMLIGWITAGPPEMSGEETATALNLYTIAGLGFYQFVYYAWLGIEVAILSFTFRYLSQNDESTRSSQRVP